MKVNNTSFKNGITNLREVKLAPEKKEAIFNTLSHYVEAHPAVTNEDYLAALLRVVRSLFSTISWK